MANWLEIVQGILSLMPLIEMVISLIERLFGSMGGSDKKVMAVDAVKSMLPSIVPGKTIPNEVLGLAVDAAVWAKNIGGEFKHADPLTLDMEIVQMFGA
jgi:Flp pilus assembly protein protease CpaA